MVLKMRFMNYILSIRKRMIFALSFLTFQILTLLDCSSAQIIY